MSIPMLAFSALAAAVGYIFLRAAPRATAVLWIAVLFFVPIWVGITAGPFWYAITMVTLIAIASFLGASVRLSVVDAIAAVLTIVIVAQFTLRMTSLSSMFTALTEWIVPYVWGRLVLTRVSSGYLSGAVAAIATLAAVLAVHEGITGENMFVGVEFGSSGLHDLWAELQLRGGMLRAEGAFGHSIALGASLGIASAFVLAARWHVLVRLSCLGVIVVATSLTLSRIGLVTLAVTIALSVLLQPGLSALTRLSVIAAGLIAVAIVIPFLSTVFLDAGSEAGGSADYRWDLLGLVPLIPLFGSAADFSGLTEGGVYLGDFAKSVDNAILVAALRVGWVPTLLLLAMIVLACLPLLRRGGASPAAIAVTGQLPGLVAVAFITQYAFLFWFVVGLAVAEETGRRADSAVPLVRRETKERASRTSLIGSSALAIARAGDRGIEK
ncbi:MAG: hypothetical protein QM677_00880 [Microbacterium sp.]